LAGRTVSSDHADCVNGADRGQANVAVAFTGCKNLDAILMQAAEKFSRHAVKKEDTMLLILSDFSSAAPGVLCEQPSQHARR
jgi:hypothetical protein